MEVGRTDTHVVFRAGPFTIACEVPKQARFPEVERVIPQPAEVVTRLRLDAGDASFLESALGRLPGDGEINAPVTLDLNGEVAVRATSADQPKCVTELVLGRSSYTGSPVSICTNRSLLERALRLGFRELGFTGIESPFVCRDASRVFAVQPLSGGSPPPADAEIVRIESGTADGGERRTTAGPESPRRATTVSESHDGHAPAPPAASRNDAEPRGSRNGTAPRMAGNVTAVGPDQPTSLAALIQEAESLHAALADARSRTARLIAGLRRQRKQSRLVNETLKSLRQLKLVEAAG